MSAFLELIMAASTAVSGSIATGPAVEQEAAKQFANQPPAKVETVASTANQDSAKFVDPNAVSKEPAKTAPQISKVSTYPNRGGEGMTDNPAFGVKGQVGSLTSVGFSGTNNGGRTVSGVAIFEAITGTWTLSLANTTNGGNNSMSFGVNGVVPINDFVYAGMNIVPTVKNDGKMSFSSSEGLMCAFFNGSDLVRAGIWQMNTGVNDTTFIGGEYRARISNFVDGTLGMKVGVKDGNTRHYGISGNVRAGRIVGFGGVNLSDGSKTVSLRAFLDGKNGPGKKKVDIDLNIKGGKFVKVGGSFTINR
ncbi:MAG: hypothetical protein V1909_02695 [Candidatus Micrarchaeota archaeon]